MKTYTKPKPKKETHTHTYTFLYIRSYIWLVGKLHVQYADFSNKLNQVDGNIQYVRVSLFFFFFFFGSTSLINTYVPKVRQTELFGKSTNNILTYNKPNIFITCSIIFLWRFYGRGLDRVVQFFLVTLCEKENYE